VSSERVVSSDEMTDPAWIAFDRRWRVIGHYALLLLTLTWAASITPVQWLAKIRAW
jgi:hypothetical protein